MTADLICWFVKAHSMHIAGVPGYMHTATLENSKLS